MSDSSLHTPASPGWRFFFTSSSFSSVAQSPFPDWMNLELHRRYVPLRSVNFFFIPCGWITNPRGDGVSAFCWKSSFVEALELWTRESKSLAWSLNMCAAVTQKELPSPTSSTCRAAEPCVSLGRWSRARNAGRTASSQMT